MADMARGSGRSGGRKPGGGAGGRSSGAGSKGGFRAGTAGGRGARGAPPAAGGRPARGGAAKPARGDAPKPARGDGPKPLRADARKPARGASAKPARGDGFRPARPDAPKPTRGASAKQATTGGAKPASVKGRAPAGPKRPPKPPPDRGVPWRAPVPRSALPPERPEVDVHDPDGVRLQKLLAAAGVGSRRVCEDLITAGRVSVEGQTVRELGLRIDPVRQAVHVDGVRVQLDESRVYLAFNKPLGVVSTMSDDLGRPCIGDYVANRSERLFHVGRLDADTDGLILLTNDGELAHRLQHPSYGVLKTYVATVPGPVARDVGRTLRAGVRIDDKTVAVDHFKLVDSTPGKALVELGLHEGSKHVVRRLLDAVGYPVQTLTRTDVGPVRLGQLGSGKVRPLNSLEIGQLYTAAGM